MSWTVEDLDTAANDGVAADPAAVERGGALRVAVRDWATSLIPWSDGSGDTITIRPMLPDGVSLGNITEVANGWRADLSNGWTARLLDLQASKYAPLLGDFYPHGTLLVYTIPAAGVEIDTDGWWRPKRLRVGGQGIGNFSAAVQRPGDLLPDSVSPPWAPYSIAIYHDTKQHNQTNGPKYMTGKAGVLPAPTFVVRDAANQIIGHGFGRWEWDRASLTLTKAFHGSQLQPYAGAAAVVQVAAELGYTTTPTTATTTVDYVQGHGPWTLPDDASLDSYHEYANMSHATDKTRAALWAGTSTVPGALIAASEQLFTPGSGGWKWHTLTVPSPPTITAQTLWMATSHTSISGGTLEAYDSGQPTRLIRDQSVSDANTAMNDPFSTSPGLNLAGYAVGTYITYTVGGGGSSIAPLAYHHRQQMRG